MSYQLYRYPSIYIEGNKPTTDKPSIFQLVDGKFILLRGEPKEPYARVFIREIYENSHLKVLDLYGSRVKKSYIIYAPQHDLYLLIERETPISLLEVSGKRVHIYLSEGDKVLEGDRIATIITNKLEIRNVRSLAKGIIVLISECLEPTEKYIIAVTGEDNVRKINVKPY